MWMKQEIAIAFETNTTNCQVYKCSILWLSPMKKKFSMFVTNDVCPDKRFHMSFGHGCEWRIQGDWGDGRDVGNSCNSKNEEDREDNRDCRNGRDGRDCGEAANNRCDEWDGSDMDDKIMWTNKAMQMVQMMRATGKTVKMRMMQVMQMMLPMLATDWRLRWRQCDWCRQLEPCRRFGREGK